MALVPLTYLLAKQLERRSVALTSEGGFVTHCEYEAEKAREELGTGHADQPGEVRKAYGVRLLDCHQDHNADV